MQKAQNFFSNKNVIVQVEGVSGLQILKAQPFLAVAILTTGVMLFFGCGAIVGNNTVGKTLVTTGDALAISMKAVEIMWNSYKNPVIQKVFRIPLILNMTQTFKTELGYTVGEFSKYISLNKKSLLKAIKDKIIHWLS